MDHDTECFTKTDIPAYFSEWLVNRLHAGFVLTRNPMNHSQVSKIALSPDVVDCIVFWTKDPVNMLDKLDLIDKLGYLYYFQFTITPYDKSVEKGLRDKEDIINTFRELSCRIGKEKVIWRYDPIIINDMFDFEYHKEQFSRLCSKLGKYTGATIALISGETGTSANPAAVMRALILVHTIPAEMAAFIAMQTSAPSLWKTISKSMIRKRSF